MFTALDDHLHDLPFLGCASSFLVRLWKANITQHDRAISSIDNEVRMFEPVRIECFSDVLAASLNE